MERQTPKPGQESVWDYPRPPRQEAVDHHIEVFFEDKLIADTVDARRVLETSHPPSYYLPRDDVDMSSFRPSKHRTFCEFKGVATYYDLVVGDRVLTNVAWTYEDPTPDFAAITGHLAFYPSHFDCYLDGDSVRPQPGGFYGGWITDNIVGPFKGGPGSQGW